jgi:hypothetical protein
MKVVLALILLLGTKHADQKFQKKQTKLNDLQPPRLRYGKTAFNG